MRLRLYELKPIRFEGFRYWKGTRQAFGLRAAITQLSPLLNTIINWKYRGIGIVIDESAFHFRNGDKYSAPQVIKGGRK